MKAKFLSTLLSGLLLGALSVAAGAEDLPMRSPYWGDAPAMLAQLSSEERRALRERWERMSPEERAGMRQKMRDRLQSLPPEERERRRREMLEQSGEMADEEREIRRQDGQQRRDDRWGDAERGFRQDEREGFGWGFERRGFRRDRPGR